MSGSTDSLTCDGSGTKELGISQGLPSDTSDRHSPSSDVINSVPFSVQPEVYNALYLNVYDFACSTAAECDVVSSLNSEEREAVHHVARSFGINSKTRGFKQECRVTLFKRQLSSILCDEPWLKLLPTARLQISSLHERFPLTMKEKMGLQVHPEKEKKDINYCRNNGFLAMGLVQIPPERCIPDPNHHTFSSIMDLRELLIFAIAICPVVIITGPPHCGKSSQIPQFIMDEYHKEQYYMRLVSSQATRLSAGQLASQVAEDRGETSRLTTGYVARLESMVPPSAILTYCTHDVLLRSLMSGSGFIATVSHLILDDMEEFCENWEANLLLLALRDLLSRTTHMRLIIIISDINRTTAQLLSTYFNKAPIFEVTSTSGYPREAFLEDILLCEGMDESAEKRSGMSDAKVMDMEIMQFWLQGGSQKSVSEKSASQLSSIWSQLFEASLCEQRWCVENEEVTPELQAEADIQLERAWYIGNEDALTTLAAFFLKSHISVDTQHSKMGITALAVAAAHGSCVAARFFLCMGANPLVIMPDRSLPADWARVRGFDDLANFLATFTNVTTFKGIDISLHALLIEKILLQCEGNILVFLSSCLEVCDLLKTLKARGKNLQFTAVLIHPFIPSTDLKFDGNSRVVYLTTHAWVCHVELPGVLHVIDCGRSVAEWITQEEANHRLLMLQSQGTCYHMYPKARFLILKHQGQNSSQKLLPNLCVTARTLLPNDVRLATFLSFLPHQVPSEDILKTIKSLEKQGIFDEHGGLMELGLNCLDLPLDPQLGKMVLYAIALKCLDPILTIVCCLIQPNIFWLPETAEGRRAAYRMRNKLADGCLSDHFVLLRVFQLWQQARSSDQEENFCNQYYACPHALAQANAVRCQLVAQLRASGFIRPRGPSDMRDLNVFSESWSVVKAALVAGSYPCIAYVDREMERICTENKCEVECEPLSVLNESYISGPEGGWKHLDTDWIIFHKQEGLFLQCCTAVSPIPIALLSGSPKIPPERLCPFNLSSPDVSTRGEGNVCNVILDEWISFRMEPRDAYWLAFLRLKWSSYFLHRISFPFKPWSQVSEESAMQSLVTVLLKEEKHLDARVPHGIGLKPRFMCLSSVLKFPPSVFLVHFIPSAPTLFSLEERFSDLLADGHQQQNQKAPALSAEKIGAGSRSRTEHSVHYHLIKASNQDTIHAGCQAGQWAFSHGVENRLLTSLNVGRVVYILLSIEGSGSLQGYAELSADIVPTKVVQFAQDPHVGPAFKLTWVKKAILSFTSAKKATNLDLWQCENGQQLDPKVGETLCQLMDRCAAKALRSTHSQPVSPLEFGSLWEDIIPHASSNAHSQFPHFYQ
ncbi:unnamed protein product [Darwinula stevensoni]|uniref:RNA helicase n=1 Tax=Darwinula stevensoni TaxID=69355 RepID=A0A7R8XHZ5_9CRUS|nr:unnamed protein product [Darwinula stevensoni]CAG0890819.1 unnamed protein product [Darwinula stevensoni]